MLDATVVVSLFVPQPATDASIALLEHALARDDAALLAPDCLFCETTAALRKYERQGVYRSLDEDLLRLQALPITVVSCRKLMRDAAALSRAHLLSPYDAFYLALAQREGAPLVTADERLVNGVRGKGFDVRDVRDARL